MPRTPWRDRREEPEITQEQAQGVPYAGPGAREQDPVVDPALAGMLLSGAADAPLVGAFRTGAEPERPRIGQKEIARATESLTEY